ncbi:hypothetical protein CR513_31573, partial [Mucuna pruriens]
MSPQGNSPSLEDLIKQLATSHLEFQQNMNSNNMQFQKNMSATIQDLKMQIGQLANIMSHSQSVGPDNSVPLPFSTWTLTRRRPETDEELLRMFRKVEINIPLLDAIKQISKYAKFLKKLCMHKRKKMKGGVELGGIVSTLTKNEEFMAEGQ